jgi:hypothetical protein
VVSFVPFSSVHTQALMLRRARRARLEARGLLCRVLLSQRTWRGKNHSSHGGGKAYLDFELKDRRRPEVARFQRVLDFKVQIRSTLPCDEWGGAAGAAMSFFRGPVTAGENE